MAWDDQGLILIVIIGVVVALISVLILVVIHKKEPHNLVFHSRDAEEGRGDTSLYNTASPLGRWAPLTVDTWIERCGVDVAMYLTFFRWMLVAFGGYSLFGLGLIALNSTDNYLEEFLPTLDPPEEYSSGLSDWTLQNVQPKSWRLWLHLVGSVLLSVLVWFAVWKILKTYAYLKLFEGSKSVDQLRTSIVYAADPPDDTVRLVAQHHSTQVSDLSVPRKDKGKWIKLLAKREGLVLKLEHAVAHADVKGERLLAKRKLCSAKEDAIELHQQQLEEVDTLLEEQVALYKAAEPAGPTFLTFANMPAHNEWRRSRLNCSPAPPCQVDSACKPSEVVWPNLHRKRGYQIGMGIVVFIIWLLLLILWTIPVAFLSSLDNLAGIPGIGSAFEFIRDANVTVSGLLQSLLPVIVLAVFNIFLPSICRKLTMMHGVHTVGALDAGTVRKWFLFTFFVLIGAAILGGGPKGVSDIAKDATVNKGLNLLIRIVSPKPGFFTAQVVSAAFIGTFVGWMVLGPVIVGFLGYRKALNDKERTLAYRLEAPPMWQVYPQFLTVSGLCLAFGVTIPILPFFGTIYMYLMLVREQYLFSNVWPFAPPTDLTLPPTVIQLTLFGLDIHQWGMISVFVGKEKWAALGVYAIFPFLTLAMHVVVHLKPGMGLAPTFDQLDVASVPDSEPQDTSLTEGQVEHPYTHPMENYTPDPQVSDLVHGVADAGPPAVDPAIMPSDNA